jgi:signal peptidase I
MEPHAAAGFVMQAKQVLQTAGVQGFLEAAKTILIAGALAVGIHTFLFQPFYIPSGSMVPTLEIHDYLFVNKFCYGYSRYSFPFAPDLFAGRLPAGMPKRGDVVVFAPTPAAGSEDLIKRVIGLPGDKIELTNGVLNINGQDVGMVDEGPVMDDSDGFPVPVEKFSETLPGVQPRAGKVHPILKLTSDGFMNNTPVYTVPAGDLFMMGDNRDNSLDSRVLDDLGYVPVANVVGKAAVIFFSIDLRAPWWAFWEWPVEIRWNRLLRPVT